MATPTSGTRSPGSSASRTPSTTAASPTRSTRVSPRRSGRGSATGGASPPARRPGRSRWTGCLARELPDACRDEGDGLGDASDTDGELVGRRGRRASAAGRLLVRTRGGADTDDELWAPDIGVDGAGASAEEAAMHVVGDRQDDD